jgi:hypothetical protein
VTELRRAGAADVSALHRIASAAYSPYLPRMGGQRPGPLDVDYAAAIESSETWVACVDGTPVGFLVLSAAAPGALLELAEDRAAARRCARIRLFTHVTMVENQALYERIGYVETHRSTERARRRPPRHVGECRPAVGEPALPDAAAFRPRGCEPLVQTCGILLLPFISLETNGEFPPCTEERQRELLVPRS